MNVNLFQEVRTRLAEEMKQVEELKIELAEKDEPPIDQLAIDNTAVGYNYISNELRLVTELLLFQDESQIDADDEKAVLYEMNLGIEPSRIEDINVRIDCIVSGKLILWFLEVH